MKFIKRITAIALLFSIIFTSSAYASEGTLATNENAQTPFSGVFTVFKNLTVDNDYVIDDLTTELNLTSTKVLKTLTIGADSKIRKIKIDKDSTINTIILKKNIKIENNGKINEILGYKDFNLSGEGSTNFALLNKKSVINSKIEVVFETSKFIKNKYLIEPTSLYIGQEKIYNNSELIKVGFNNIFGIDFYFDNEKNIIDGIIKDGENTYYLTELGKYVGFLKTEEATKYFDENGIMKTGAVKINDDSYLFDNEGNMKIGIVEIGDKSYFYGDDGKLKLDGLTKNLVVTKEGKLISKTTGDDELDADIESELKKIVNDSMTEKEKLLAVYDWGNNNIRYLYIPTDTSNGIKDDVQVKLAKVITDDRRGSCYHFASYQSYLLQRMGYQTRVIVGKGAARLEEHAWTQIWMDGHYVNFDPQYEKGYMRSKHLSNFLIGDEEFSKSHVYPEGYVMQ